jgi:hypothetical protein
MLKGVTPAGGVTPRDRQLVEASRVHWYAERYGWTKRETDEHSPILLADLRLTALVLQDMQDEADRQARASASAQQARGLGM